MKKGISWLLLAVLVGLFFGTFVSCGSSSSEQLIQLTKDNYSNYLKVSARYYGGDASWSSAQKAYGYYSRIFDVSISPAASYLQFTGYCYIQVKISGSYADYPGYSSRYEDKTLRVQLDIGGNGSDSAYEMSPYPCYDLKGVSYDVVSVDGQVKVMS